MSRRSWGSRMRWTLCHHNRLIGILRSRPWQTQVRDHCREEVSFGGTKREGQEDMATPKGPGRKEVVAEWERCGNISTKSSPTDYAIWIWNDLGKSAWSAIFSGYFRCWPPTNCKWTTFWVGWREIRTCCNPERTIVRWMMPTTWRPKSWPKWWWKTRRMPRARWEASLKRGQKKSPSPKMARPESHHHRAGRSTCTQWAFWSSGRSSWPSWKTTWVPTFTETINLRWQYVAVEHHYWREADETMAKSSGRGELEVWRDEECDSRCQWWWQSCMARVDTPRGRGQSRPGCSWSRAMSGIVLYRVLRATS